MNLSRLFIDRPVATTLLTLGVARDESHHPAAAPDTVRPSPWRDLRDGIAHVWTTQRLLALMWIAFLVNGTDTFTGQLTLNDGIVRVSAPAQLNGVTSVVSNITVVLPNTSGHGGTLQLTGNNTYNIPMTINVIPRTVLDLQEAQGLYDALKNTAGVARSQTSGTVADNLSIRGVATENRTSFRLNVCAILW